MCAGHIVAESESRPTKKLTFDGGNFYINGVKAKIRINDDVFSVGCTLLSWQVFGSLKRIVEAGR